MDISKNGDVNDIKAVMKTWQALVDNEKSVIETVSKLIQVLDCICVEFEIIFPHNKNDEPDNEQHSFEQSSGKEYSPLVSEIRDFFLTSILPGSIRNIMKKKYLDESVIQCADTFLKRVLSFVPPCLQKGVLPIDLVRPTALILDTDAAFYYNRGKAEPSDKYLDPFSCRPTTWASELLVSNVNHFGSCGGFNAIFEQLPHCPVTHLHIFLDVIYQPVRANFIVSGKLSEFVKVLQQTLVPRIFRLSSSEIKTMQKDETDKIFLILISMFEKVLPLPKSGEIVETMFLHVALQCFQSKTFDKRIYGLQCINTMISNVESAERYTSSLLTSITNPHTVVTTTPNSVTNTVVGNLNGIRIARWLNGPVLVGWIESNDLMTDLFGVSAHQQLVARSNQLLRFMARQKALNHEHWGKIWETALHAHESVATVVMKVIGDEAAYFSSDQIKIIFDFVRSIPRTELTLTQLGLVYDLSRKCSSFDHKVDMVELLWSFVLDNGTSGPPLDIALQSLKYLEQVLTSYWFKTYRDEWIKKIVVTIHKKLSVSFCLDLLSAIIDTYPKTKTVPEEESVFFLTQDLEQKYGLSSIVVDELCEFHATAAKEILKFNQNEASNPGNLNLGGRMEYEKEMQTRLNFLVTYLSNSSKDTDITHFQKIWETLITNALYSTEADMCFSWLTTTRTKKAVDDVALVALFHCMLEPSFVAAINSSAAMKCFQLWFCAVNALQEKIKWSPDQEHTIEVQVEDLQNLSGYWVVWEISLTATVTEVSQQSRIFLNQLHTCVSPAVRNSLGEKKLRQLFLDNCMEFISIAVHKYSSNVISYRKRIVSLLELLNQFVSRHETAKRTKTHGTLSRGKPIALQFVFNESRPDTITFSLPNMHTNLTCCELKKRISEHFKSHFSVKVDDIFLFWRQDQLPNNDTTLSSFQFTNNETITVHTLPNLGENETFLRSRVSTSTMSPAITSSTYVPPHADRQATQLVEIYGITKPAAMLALKKYYWNLDSACTYLCDEKVKAKLQDEANKQEGISSETCVSEAPSVVDTSLPSNMLASSPIYFTQLSNLLDLDDNVISQHTWDLLMSLPTSKIMQDAILTLNGIISDNNVAHKEGTPPKWLELFDLRSPYKLLYSLQVVDVLLFPSSNLNVSDETLQRSWCEGFLALGGLKHLLGSLPLLVASTDAPVRKCLGLALKVIDFFLNALGSSSEEAQLLGRSGELIRQSSEASFAVVLPQLNLIDLVQVVLSILENVSNSSFVEDCEVVAYAMRVLVYCSTSHCAVQVLDKLVQEQFVKIVQKILCQCLDATVRHEFSEGLFSLVSIVDSSKLFSFVMETFLSTVLPLSDTLEKAQWTNCSQSFQLFTRLLVFGLSSQYDFDRTVYRNLIFKHVSTISDRPIVETKNDTDFCHVGAMDALRCLLSFFPEEKRALGDIKSYNLVYQLYYDCLFALKTESTENSLPKCKTSVSRRSATSLLIELCTGSSDNWLQLLDLLEHHHTGGTKITKWSYHPGSEDKASCGMVGLKNLGNTCYMNSMLQQLYMIKGLVKTVMSVAPAENPEDSIIAQMQFMFGALQESEKRAFDTSGLCAAYKKATGSDTSVQQDVDEFFNILWQRLENQLKGTPQEKEITQFFVGSLANQILSTDSEYPYFSEREEDFHAISLDIKDKKTIQEALDLFVFKDKLEGENAYACEEYNTKINAIMRRCLKKLPNTLILHLKRFEYDYNRNQKVKINDNCSFPLHLNMRPWTREGLDEKEEIKMKDLEDHPAWYYEYHLVGVVVHSGSSEGGHYYSYIKDRTTNIWYNFNDDSVQVFNPEELSSECFGGKQMVKHWDNWIHQHVEREYDRIRNAYMLIYERENVQDHCSLDDLSTTAMTNGIPEKIYSKVWKENARFLQDRQFFDPIYFDFLLHFGKIWSTSIEEDVEISQDDPQIKKLRLLTFFALEFLTHSVDSELILPEWFEFLKCEYNKHIPACRWFLEYVVEHDRIKELLLDCTNEHTRLGFEQLLIHVMRSLSKHEYPIWDEEDIEILSERKHIKRPAPLVLRTFDSIWNLLEESRSRWRIFKQYFKTIYDFASIGPLERSFLLHKRDIIPIYNDYFMGSTSKHHIRRLPVMDALNLPDLREFVATLSLLYRSCSRFCDTTTVSETPFSLTSELCPPPTNMIRLFDDHFFSSLLEMDYNRTAIMEILQHACWEDSQRTNYIFTSVMNKLKDPDPDVYAMWSELLTTVLNLEDSLQGVRVKIALDPFLSTTPTKGLLYQLRDSYNRIPQLATNHVTLIMSLAEKNSVAASFLLSQPQELLWIKSFLEAKIGPKGVSSVMNSIENVTKGTLNIEQPLEKAYSIICAMASKLPAGASSTNSVEQELRAEIRELQEALLYYYQRCPPVIPHPYILSSKWKDFLSRIQQPSKVSPEVPQENESPSAPKNPPSYESTQFSEGCPDSDADTSSTGTVRRLDDISEPPDIDLDKIAQQLTDIFPITKEVALVALKHNDYDVNTSAAELTEPAFLEQYKREAQS